MCCDLKTPKKIILMCCFYVSTFSIIVSISHENASSEYSEQLKNNPNRNKNPKIPSENFKKSKKKNKKIHLLRCEIKSVKTQKLMKNKTTDFILKMFFAVNCIRN